MRSYDISRTLLITIYGNVDYTTSRLWNSPIHRIMYSEISTGITETRSLAIL